jgi:putative ABC transport system permease protein
MLAHYLKMALKVLARRKFFAAVSLFGIAVTLVVLTVATAILDHTVATMPPEVSQDRTLVVARALMRGDRATWRSDPGYLLLDRYARGLPGVERLSITTSPRTVYSYIGGNRVQSVLRRTDADFWRILQFDFREGAPFAADDVAQAQPVAVINASTRTRFFGREPALGRAIEVDGQRFRVVGVVADVSRLRFVPFADVWVPMTTAKTDSYRSQLMGGCVGIALLADGASRQAVQQEFASRLKRAELPDPKLWKHLYAPIETMFEQQARAVLGVEETEESPAARLWMLMGVAAVLFMTLPAVNLVNLNVSRILERASEIGVRKSFGAPTRTLVLQFVVENLVLTLVGAGLAFVLSQAVLSALTASGLVPYAQLRLNYRVFLAGLALAGAFGLLSGAYPAWRMARLNPVEALKGAVR